MTPEAIRARAYAARAMIDDETLKAGWDEIENELRDEWERSVWPSRRNRIWAELRHIRKLRQRLASFAGQARE